MNNQDQVPTIAELWKEADGLIRLSIPHLEKLASPDYQVNEEMRPFYTNQLASCNERLKYLRQQLVERCKIFRGHFDKLENRIRFGITVFQTETVSMTTPEGHGMPLNANDLMELSAICAFWAWEIEQREKEASGD